MFGFDWPRLHAALNDLPAALLLTAVLFDLLGAALKRDSLKAAGFWSLIVGVLGTGAAVLAGKLAEGATEATEHSAQAHAVLETHETLGFIVLVLFALLAAWRLVRRGVWGPREQPVALTAGVIGVALLVYTAVLGGNLVFDHAVGVAPAAARAASAPAGAARPGQADGDSDDAPALDSNSPHTHR
ncbi:MAG: DUF2231 domain-containing protein [Gemmatimonadetes bacterium]|nr:DUF2231 domain-containing protein [Gemmatimonadota bacterium]